MNFVKRAFSAALLAATLITPFAGQAETEYFTLKQLRERTETHWTQTYETPYRTLEVDANVYLPEADAMPVLRVRLQDMSSPTLTAEESGWDEVTGRRDSLILYNEDAAVPRSRDGRKLKREMTARGVWYEGFSPDAQYVPLSQITFGEICEQIRAELTRFGVDPDEYAIDAPARLWAQHYEYEGTSEDALPGCILMTIDHKVRGIPVLSDAQTVARDADDKRRVPSKDLAPVIRMDLSAGYDAYLERVSHLFVRRAEILDTLAEDIPLCSFDTVRANIEKDIETGRLDKIFDVRLGYLTYDEPAAEREKDNARAYLKPAWVVSCRWLDTPQSAPGEASGDERNAIDFYTFAYDAQTGERISGSSIYDGFISWNEAQ